jgi:hypothetical protein
MSPRLSVLRPHRLALLAAVVLTAACGSSGPVGSPYSPVIRVAKQGEFVALPAAGDEPASAAKAITVVVVNNPVSGGSLHAGVNWTSSSNHMEAGFFTGECTAEQIVSQACHAERYVPTAQLVNGRQLDLYSANAGNYTLAIINLGPGSESGTYEIDLLLPTAASPY